MISFRRKLLLKALKLFDLAGMIISFLLGGAMESYEFSYVSLSNFLSMRIKIQNFIIFFTFLLVWHAIFSSFGLYHSKRLSSQWKEIVDVIKATTLGTAVIALAALPLRVTMVTPVFLATFWAGSSAIIILSRFMLRYTSKQLRIRGRNLRNILIVGTNPRAIEFARKIESRPELGYCLIGFVDNTWAKHQEFLKTGYALVADLKEFPAFIRTNVVDEVVICLPVQSFYQQFSQLVALCKEQGILVRFLSDIFNLKPGKTKTEQFEGDSVITVSNGSMEGWPILVKRWLDFSLSAILLILLFPLFAVTAILIKLSSPGPVFFVQERVGLNKRKFRLFKFRTMVQDAENMQAELEDLNEISGPVFKIKDDPRITPIGKFLRKTSIDELPQLINVLKGDMSLVGPRPLPVRDYNGFDQDWQRRRFSVKPGITCLWQVNGRSDTPFEKWMELDMQYIDSWSLWLDLKILFQTIPAVLKGSGAG